MRDRLDPGLCLALAAGLALFLYQISWGLPAAGHSWAVDALAPVTVLLVARALRGRSAPASNEAARSQALLGR